MAALCFAVTATPAEAGKYCGEFDDGGKTWHAIASRTGCSQATEVARTYVRRQNRSGWQFDRTYIWGWRCYWGARTPGTCDTGRGRQAIWVLNYKDPRFRGYRWPPPKLDWPQFDLRDVLRRKYGHRWIDGYLHKVKCLRLSRLKQRCVATWLLGDIGFHIRARVTLRPAAGRWGTTVIRGRATLTNYYCLAVTHPGDRLACAGHHRVGPVVISR